MAGHGAPKAAPLRKTLKRVKRVRADSKRPNLRPFKKGPFDFAQGRLFDSTRPKQGLASLRMTTSNLQFLTIA
jgi:hypothetical protein